MIIKSRMAAIGLLLALSACSQQDQASTFKSGAPGMQGRTALPASPVSGSRSFDAIANSPDLGALVNYDRRAAPVTQGAYTSHRVEVSEDHAIRAILTGRLSIPAPGGEYLQLVYERHAESINGNWTWVGRLAGGDQSQEAIITFGEKAVFGSIPQSGGRPALSLTTRAGQLWVVETDPRLVPATDRREQDTLVREAGAGRPLAASAPLATQVTSSSAATATATASSNTIDVLLGYTSGFAAKFGGQSQAVTRLTHLVDLNNQAFSNSQINGVVRLVGTQQVNYTDGGTNRSALIDLTGSDGSNATTVPASLQPLRAARDSLGADLVALVRAYEYVNEGCGVAWLLGAGQQQIVPSEDARFAYSMVSDLPDGTSVKGTDGNNYLCSKETLAHELGHLMGSAHDIENATSSNGVVRYGRYAYSFGAKTDPTAGNYYTIMSYGDDGQKSYRVFSNPNVMLCGGLACGVANKADNARSLNQTIPLVAEFRASVAVSPAPKIVSDVDGDARSDLLWHNERSGQFGYWLMSGPSVRQMANVPVTLGYRIPASGDFNADGREDVLWTSNARDLWLWSGSSGATFASAKLGSYSAQWAVVGSGDVNADGKDDILWHNATEGRFGYWIMDGASIRTATNIPVAVGYRIASSGDFNGDGYLDIVWTSDLGDLWLWSGSTGGQFSSAYMGTYGGGWAVVGAGDIDANGRDDLLWHNASGGQFGYWLLDGARVLTMVNVPVTVGYRIINTGDYNGDGRLDVVWTSAKLDLWMWSGSSSSTFNSNFLGTYGDGWQVVDAGVR